MMRERCCSPEAQTKADARAAPLADAKVDAEASACLQAVSEVAEDALSKLLTSKARPRTKNHVILAAWDKIHPLVRVVARCSRFILKTAA